MVDGPTGMSLPDALARTGLSIPELWVRYFALGGDASPFALEAYLHGVLEPAALDHDMIAHALNEELSDRGQDRPLGYIRP